jgi:acyl carrier protein
MEGNEKILSDIRECMQLALELEPAEVQSITVNSTAADLAKWDSLGHLRLIFELEIFFGITLDDEQIMQMGSVDRIIQVVENNGR